MSEGLHFFRTKELEIVAAHLPSGARVLEVGAGTGFQATALSEMRFNVTAIDIPPGSPSLLYDVMFYDGRNIPFSDSSFDVVFSSNALEHVDDLPHLLGEMRRVLAPSGFCVHVMPTTTWRIWSAVSGYVAAVKFLWDYIIKTPRPAFRVFVRGMGARLIPLHHGVRGNSVTELWYFTERCWSRTFADSGFSVEQVIDSGLLYSNWLVFGPRFASLRAFAALVLGSTCKIYFIRPKPG